MKHKLIAALFVLLALIVSGVHADQFTQIGIIDLTEIISNYFRESRAYRELEEMRSEFEDDRQRIMDEIDQLEERKLNAENLGQESTVLRLEDEIFEKKEYLQEYTRIKYNQIKKKQESLLESSAFLGEILKEVQYIAESEGYSIVFRAKDPNIVWWSQAVDITDKVLERLRQTSP
jgi:outer membrane protein